jgi:hypothetical protein
MNVSERDRRLVRDLARRIAEAAALPIQQEKIRLWKRLNSLQPERPMVLLNPQNGWVDLVSEEDLRCGSPELRDIELTLRQALFRHESIHDDYPITADWDVGWAIDRGDYGVSETYTYTEARSVFHWDPPIKTPQDLRKLRPRRIRIDREATQRDLIYAQDLLGDILHVRVRGVNHCRCGLSRQLILLRGLEQMMLDMYDNPQLLHDMMAFLRDQQLAEFDLYQREGLLALNNGPQDWTGSGGLATTDDLPAPGFDPARVRMLDMYAWAESQETVGVGPDLFYEFVLQYQLPVMQRFGLADYGCCEALDRKLDLIIAYIPHLRWVAVPTWANRELAAQKLTNRYVYCYKPQPSRICQPAPDWEGAEQELRETLRTARGCCVSLVMKDTTSYFDEPQRATRWTDMAQRVAAEAAG